MPTTLEYRLDIEAPIEVVWNVLTDFSAYSAWNTYTPVVECPLIVGGPAFVQSRMHPRGKLVMQELRLSMVRPPEILCWGRNDRYLWTERCQQLLPLEEGGTRYRNTETFGGLMAPVVLWFYREHLLEGYRLTGTGLKAWAEALVSVWG